MAIYSQVKEQPRTLMDACLQAGVGWHVFQPQKNSMSVEMFLKLDGIAGGTKKFSHKAWTDVTSRAWDMQSNRNSAKLVEGEKTAFRLIAIVKRIGVDSPGIMSLFVQGKTIASADIDIVPIVSKREGRQKYLSINLEDVRVKSIVTGGNSTEEFFNETVSLLFGRVRYEFTVNSMPGSDVAAGDFSFAWDLARNSEWQ